MSTFSSQSRFVLFLVVVLGGGNGRGRLYDEGRGGEPTPDGKPSPYNNRYYFIVFVGKGLDPLEN